ncbi:MAG: hypothetical protein L6Q51_02395 [Cyclobacteriaceae bacterium]|nr:hypothetical protein [Cyclobacteriaceae bacterium]
MKKIPLYLLTYFYLNVGTSQNFEGVYQGKIVTENNVLVLSTTAGTAVGTIHLNKSEKIVLLGTVTNGILSGSFKYDDKFWNLTGNIRNDSLIIQLSSGKENFSVKPKKLSSSTSFKFGKLLYEPPRYNSKVVGTWKIIYNVKNGVINRPDNNFEKGASYQFNASGTCKLRSPSLDKEFSKSPQSVPSCKWETRGNQLIMTMQGRSAGYGTFESYYLVKGDTLVLTYKGVDSYFVRSDK